MERSSARMELPIQGCVIAITIYFHCGKDSPYGSCPEMLVKVLTNEVDEESLSKRIRFFERDRFARQASLTGQQIVDWHFLWVERGFVKKAEWEIKIINCNCTPLFAVSGWMWLRQRRETKRTGCRVYLHSWWGLTAIIYINTCHSGWICDAELVSRFSNQLIKSTELCKNVSFPNRTLHFRPTMGVFNQQQKNWRGWVNSVHLFIYFPKPRPYCSFIVVHNAFTVRLSWIQHKGSVKGDSSIPSLLQQLFICSPGNGMNQTAAERGEESAR